MKLNHKLLFLVCPCIFIACKEGKKIGTGEKSVEARDTVASIASNSSRSAEQAFDKTVSYGQVSFKVTSPNTNSGNTVTIIPEGLAKDNSPITLDIQGSVYEAEVDDLNNDSFTDIAVYTRTASKDSVGAALIFASNNGKSISQVYVPDIKEDPQNSIGWNGHDTFALAEGLFVHNFPIYEDGMPTGKTRQLQYNVVDGEASRQIKLKRSTVF